MQPNFTVTEENYIKNIYHLQQATGYTTTNELAAAIKARPASITDMLKKLKTKKILHYEKYQGFRLSAEGKKVALTIVRRHRLWEYFLSEKLKFTWDEVHEVAEELEHVTSKKLIDKLDEFLGFPKFDPHGDPIPDQAGKITSAEQVALSDIEINQAAEVCGVANHSTHMLDMLRHNNIGIGTKLEIRKKFPFDQSLEIKIRNQAAFTISERLAQNIFVRYAKKP